MSKMACMEAVYDALVGNVPAGLDDDIFKDIVMGCYALASGEGSEPDVVAWIAARDKSRSEVEICKAICDHFRRYRGAMKPSAAMAKAVAAGRAVL